MGGRGSGGATCRRAQIGRSMSRACRPRPVRRWATAAGRRPGRELPLRAKDYFPCPAYPRDVLRHPSIGWGEMLFRVALDSTCCVSIERKRATRLVGILVAVSSIAILQMGCALFQGRRGRGQFQGLVRHRRGRPPRREFDRHLVSELPAFGLSGLVGTWPAAAGRRGASRPAIALGGIGRAPHRSYAAWESEGVAFLTATSTGPRHDMANERQPRRQSGA